MNRRAISDDAPRPVLLRLGLTPVIDAAQFAWIKPVLATRMPHVRLDVLRQGSTQLVRNLLHGRLDAAIIGTPAMTGDLQITPCTRASDGLPGQFTPAGPQAAAVAAGHCR